ncbi:ArsR/SmtB family transcription factor [Nocardioides sp. LHG3406-4]|uniref:ArsR/SmtB family transcription factor n=1 Tax=Nocardioides sp. LHG3406-4 TaxID=2804575 RepID=UPI003CFADEA8
MDAFAALGDPVRRELVQRLARGPARVVDLAADHEISRPAISRHLRVLGEAGLVAAEERGRERHYRLAPSGLAPVSAWLAGLGQQPRFGESALDGLDLEVRRTVRERSTEKHATASTEESA